MPSFAESTLIVLKKDLLIEIRTREIVTTAGFFAALTTVMASFAFYSGETTTRKVGPGAIWLPIAFASVLALSRTWQREREENALLGLLVAPIPRAALFAGKAIGVAAFISVTALIVVPIVGLLFHVELGPICLPLAALLLLGVIGIAAMGTLFGAMTVRTRARDLILASVLFPLLAPMMLAGVAGTRDVFEGAPMSELRSFFVILAVFDAIAIAGGLGMFGALVED